MRVAPLGAYFADDLDMVVEQAERSATTTHCHAEAVAGAVAVALAAALAWERRITQEQTRVKDFLRQICERTPASLVRQGGWRSLKSGVAYPCGVGLCKGGTFFSSVLHLEIPR
jgi:hypothetical protein